MTEPPPEPEREPVTDIHVNSDRRARASSSPWTRERDDRLLSTLHDAVAELDALTDRLKDVIEDHEPGDTEEPPDA